MNDLKKTEYSTVVEKTKCEHEPRVGDVYYYHTNKEFIRLESKEENKFVYQWFDFVAKQWTYNSEFNRTISIDSLKKYYEYVMFDFNEVVNSFDKYIDDGISMNIPEETESTSLVAKGKVNLELMRNENELAIERMELAQKVMESKLACQRYALEQKMKPLRDAMEVMKKTVKNITYAISVIEGYLGEGIEYITIAEGERAPQGTPVSVRQRILFMDEEVMIVDEFGNGIDYHDKNVFYEKMKEHSFRDIIVPEQRCIVVMKPRRYNRTYSSDFYENELMNKWNHHSFVVIRDGDCVDCIESDNLCVYDKVFKRIDTTKLDKWEEKKAKNLVKRTMYLCAVLQGLVEKGLIFDGDTFVNIIKGDNLNLVYDDDDNSIGSGIMPWREFLRTKNADIRRGSRILYVDGGETKRYYYNKYSIPPAPKRGVYNVDVEQGVIRFLYLPEQTIYGYWDYHERKKRESWLIDSTALYINYDNVFSNELDKYLKDRTQRHLYESILPLIVTMKKAKQEEEKWENDFVSLMEREFARYNNEDVRSAINEGIEWWKKKVIYVRPLKSDDKKSWRMIKGYVKRKLELKG